MFESFFRWPDEFVSHEIDEPCCLLRLDQFSAAESHLIHSLASLKSNSSPEPLLLLGFLRLKQDKYSDWLEIDSILENSYRDICFTDILFLRGQYLLLSRSIPDLIKWPLDHWKLRHDYWPLRLTYAALLIQLGKLGQATAELESIPSDYSHVLEVQRLRCRIFEARGLFDESLDILLSITDRFPQNLALQVHLMDVLIKSRSSSHTIPQFRKILSQHGSAEPVLPYLTTVQMLRHRIADARRSALQDRLWASLGSYRAHSSTNLLNLYEQLGQPYLLEHLSVDTSSLDFNLQQNLLMQYASLQSKSYPSAVNKVVKHYSSQGIVPSSHANFRKLSDSKQLRVGWFSSDLCYHPVGRFIFSFFSNTAQTREHSHTLIDTFDHARESMRSSFEQLPALNVLHLNKFDLNNHLNLIRDLSLDVAIDLGGWTGNHFQHGFISRLAPYQINYLGYFASVGHQSMDAWLGDNALFPTPMKEWHTEQLLRMPRCFIAWQPADPLPESNIDVVDSSGGGSIRYGCFNHTRKISDHTLSVWACLLSRVSGSKLVLKASNDDDTATQELLQRRMIRQGLDPSSVIWLPRTKSPAEHLLQYSCVDVALDCFPNGGCTTTCEALWMGTPVVTLTGLGYVSRMSTAVLQGAGMSEWCASSVHEYIQIAANQADNLAFLRSNRSVWRHKLVNNPLGDSVSLMKEIEKTISLSFDF